MEPFTAWSSPSFVTLDWWKAYNAVKHDRLANRTRATMRYAAQALAAVLVNIVTYPPALSDMARAGWVKKSVKSTSRRLLQGQPAKLKFAQSLLLSYLIDVDRKGLSGTRKQDAGTYEATGFIYGSGTTCQTSIWSTTDSQGWYPIHIQRPFTSRSESDLAPLLWCKAWGMSG